MITPELVSYIRQQTIAGVPREQIALALKQSGWIDADIAEAFNAAVPVTVPPQALHSAQSHVVRNIIIVLVVLILLGGGAWFFIQKKNSQSIPKEVIDTNTDTTVKTPQTENSDDTKAIYVPVPVEENSASIFNAIPKNIINDRDRTLWGSYINNYPGVGSISQSESQKILAKYQNVLTSFEAGVDKKYYQCSLDKGEGCPLGILRDISGLATLNAFVLFKDGKTVEAEQYAKKIIKLGQMITASNVDVVTLLVGWVVQSRGYYALHEIKPIAGLSAEDKTALINNLRNEHRQSLRVEQARDIELVDYITDVKKKPSFVLSLESEDFISKYREKVNSVTWKPDTVKKWFDGSFQTALSNVDLPCGSMPKQIKIDIGFDPNANPQPEENFVGKTFYYAAHVALDDMNAKRCDLVENRINSL